MEVMSRPGILKERHLVVTQRLAMTCQVGEASGRPPLDFSIARVYNMNHRTEFSRGFLQILNGAPLERAGGTIQLANPRAGTQEGGDSEVF
jgi:hypothetical protein